VQPPQAWTVLGDVRAALRLTASTLFLPAGLGAIGTLSLVAMLASPRARRRAAPADLPLLGTLTAALARRRAPTAELSARMALDAVAAFTTGPVVRIVDGLLSLAIGLASPTSGPRPMPPTPGPIVAGGFRREAWRYAYVGELGILVGLTARTAFRPHRPRVVRHRHAVVGCVGSRLALSARTARLDYLDDVIKPDDARVLALWLGPSHRVADPRDDDVLALLVR
jgi:hypothetical protein